ncbi:hypothetical protein RclHR1_01470013 [Rhizophagus clarus]|uniref:Uncharacterized protein n=1 Tax=Rhizophagus clarus TaxID=94130 RepID=A0A2Z6QF48_9GLOM|nr:hypothetical protein RclHR1_01470013 [Rhizophagus clarus]
MACTKVFSGNLPEIMSKILQYFQNDYSTLHSCILVNRLWCRLAIPLLWEDPFSLIYPKNYRYIEVYLNNLNENERTQLNKYGISNDLFPLNMLFNYTIFIHHLDTHIIRSSIEKWNLFIFIIVILWILILFKQIINLTKPFHLKSLFVDEPTDLLEPLQLLLQKSGNYLENFGLRLLKKKVLDLVIKYCTKIKFLEFRVLIIFIIDIYEIENVDYSILLQNLGQILPPKLEYLDLTIINISDFEIFLKNSQNTFIKKLLIKNIRNRGQQQEIEKFLPYIKEYIMKKKRTKYLDLQGYVYTYDSKVDLVHLKDEVKEFKLYNIMVQNYDYLIIDSFDFINEMY